MIMYGYYWNERNYTNGEVWGFLTKEGAINHANNNHKDSWDGDIEEFEINDNSPLEIYTGE